MIHVIGELLVDSLPEGDRIGGAPFNVAFHLHRMGWPVQLITRIGDDDHGRDIMAFLNRIRFPADGIQIDPDHPTGTVDVRLDENGVPTFDIRTDVAYDYLDLSKVSADRSAMVYVGTLVQRTDRTFAGVQDFLARQRTDLGVFVDLNLRPPHVRDDALSATLDRAAVVKLSGEELAVVRRLRQDASGTDDDSAWLRNTFNLDAVIVTRGGDGASLAVADRTVLIPAAPVGHLVDTVGAGDGFAAVAIMGLLANQAPERFGPWAAAFAADLCGESGAIPESDSIYHKLDIRLRG